MESRTTETDEHCFCSPKNKRCEMEEVTCNFPIFYKIKRPKLNNNLGLFYAFGTQHSKLKTPNYLPAALAWSAKNVAKPLSVSGCFNKPAIAAKGAVITSAPNLAQLTMCNGPRIDAAKICVS